MVDSGDSSIGSLLPVFLVPLELCIVCYACSCLSLQTKQKDFGALSSPGHFLPLIKKTKSKEVRFKSRMYDWDQSLQASMKHTFATFIFSEEFPFVSLLLLFSFPFVFIEGFSLPFLSLPTSLDLLTLSSNTAFRKLGFPRSADNCFRNMAAPSRRAWLVFSTAFL